MDARRHRARINGAVAALALWLTAGACGSDEEDDLPLADLPKRVQADGSIRLSDAERRALGLQSEPAVRAELGSTELRFGQVQARLQDQALVVAPVAGRIAGAAAVALGERVELGAEVAQLLPVLAAAERLSANVRGAELGGQIDALTREASARSAELARAEQLASSQIVSAAKLQEARTALAAAHAQLDALRNARGIQTRGEALPIVLRAPLAGVIASLEAPLGGLVSAGAVVARILRPGPLWIDVEVAPDAPPGDRYAVLAGEHWLPARLLARGAVVDEDGVRRDRIECEPGDAVLLPGASVRVRVGHDTQLGAIVPEAALVPHADGVAIYVEQAPGSFVRRAVVIAARGDDQVRIGSGLQAGERVVIRGAQALRGESLRNLLQERD